jgi:hypothetical protein
MGRVVVHADAEAPFDVGDRAVVCILYGDADVCQGEVGGGIQYDAGDRFGLCKTGLG